MWRPFRHWKVDLFLGKVDSSFDINSEFNDALIDLINGI